MASRRSPGPPPVACLCAAMALLGGLLWASEPPVRDSIQVSAAVLVQGETVATPAFHGEWTVLPAKKLPSSVSIYLKPSKVVDSRSDTVRKAAAQALRLMGQGLSKQTLADPKLMAEAARDWVDMNLAQPGEDFESRPYATDTRTLLPKASQLIQLGQADWDGRVRVRLALLRALGVPARSAWLRGRSTIQYWAEWLKDEPDSPKQKKSGAATKEAPKLKGEWVLDETSFPGESPEAWSLDATELAPALWLPEQELAYEATLEQAYFALSETALATQTLDFIRANGAMPLSLSARALPPRKGPWLMLANHRARFFTEGSMEALNPLELLLPYRPKLANWGSQQRPVPDSLQTLAAAFWTDRPDRARTKKNGDWTDEYKSPPPAYGILHYASISLRKPASILDAHLEGNQVVGKLLRRDSLAPRAHWDIQVRLLGSKSMESLSSTTDSLGGFRVPLDAAQAKAAWIRVSGGQGSLDVTRWDTLLLQGMP
jgi:hypothetical protein